MILSEASSCNKHRRDKAVEYLHMKRMHSCICYNAVAAVATVQGCRHVHMCSTLSIKGKVFTSAAAAVNKSVAAFRYQLSICLPNAPFSKLCNSKCIAICNCISYVMYCVAIAL